MLLWLATHTVGHQYASVDNVRADVFAGRAVIDVLSAAGRLVRDSAETPLSVGLGGEGVDRDNGILLDVLDLNMA